MKSKDGCSTMNKRVVSISWNVEVLDTLDRYADSLRGALDAGIVGGSRQRSALINNMVARELRRVGFPVKMKGDRK